MNPDTPRSRARDTGARALLLMLLAASPTGAQSPAAAGAGDLAGSMDKVAAGVYKPSAPGAAIIVVKNSQVLFRKGYGMANLELGIPVSPDMNSFGTYNETIGISPAKNAIFRRFRRSSRCGSRLIRITARTSAWPGRRP